MKKLLVTLLSVCILCGCATAPTSRSRIGESQCRTLVILGEHIYPGVAQQYADKYQAQVYYSASHGPIADAVSSSLRGAVGPSSGMKQLIEELKSMNNTNGEWKLIIPQAAERYFLIILRNINTGTLSNAVGKVCLVESSQNKDVEQEVQRVTNGAFSVEYRH